MSGIIRTYRRDTDGTLRFREAWIDEPDGDGPAYLIVNHGAVGHQSSTDETVCATQDAAEALLAAFAVQCAADGFEVVAETDQQWVIAQWALKTKDGTERDSYLRNKAVDALTPHLAWRGAGTVEGSELGDGRLTVTMLSPEPAKTVAAVKTCIREARLDFTKLTISVAPYADITAAKVKHPR